MKSTKELTGREVVYETHSSYYTLEFDESGEEIVIDILPDGTLSDGGFHLDRLEAIGYSRKELKHHFENYGLVIIEDELRWMEKSENQKAALNRFTYALLALGKE